MIIIMTEVPIRTRSRYQFTANRMAIVKKIIRSVAEVMEKLETLCVAGENVNGTAALENSLGVFEKALRIFTI